MINSPLTLSTDNSLDSKDKWLASERFLVHGSKYCILIATFNIILFLLCTACYSQELNSSQSSLAFDKGIVGMYVHTHWAYKNPYAARTWTLSQWQGYIEGLHKLGFNTIKIWPAIETMPSPITDSDEAYLEKMRKVIDMIHSKGMKVIIALCPNVAVDSSVACQYGFEDRIFFYCDLRVNPADEKAVSSMIKWREELLRPLAKVDAITIIDSDPGGYPGSNNKEFINLFHEHRKMFDRLRPGIEIIYWMHVGWPGYCRYYEKGEFDGFSTESEYLEAIHLLEELNPEPWGLASHIEMSKKAGLLDKAVDYRYGAIEGEPSFPLTNYGGSTAYEAGSDASGRGVMGNAQTHCVQLPNTFAFSRGATGKSIDSEDYLEFAERLIVGKGARIVEAWEALRGSDPNHMLSVAGKLRELSRPELEEGDLGGLLFGDPERFLLDLVYQLEFQARYLEFIKASEQDDNVLASFREFVEAFAAWQERHGYGGRWTNWNELDQALTKLGSPAIEAILHPEIKADAPFARVKEDYYLAETATARMVEALKQTLEKMENDSPSAATNSSDQ